MILTYHKVDLFEKSKWWVPQDRFRRQMMDLADRDVVYLDDYDPSNPDHVVITFDGIYKNVLDVAVPILQEFGYPFECFVIGDYLGRDNLFDAVEPLTLFADIKDLKAISIAGGRIQWPGGRIQWHSRTHGNLCVMEKEELITELTPNEELRAAFTSPHLDWFAYPFGDATPRIETLLKGRFKGALTTSETHGEGPYRLGRKLVYPEDRLNRTSISLIIPNYNYGAFLEEAIESAFAQTLPPDEILVIDDGSDDNSHEIMRKYEGAVRTIYNPENLGIVDNFNKAIQETDGDYICFVGADNRIRTDFVEKHKLLLDRNPDISIAYCDVILFGPRARVQAQHFGRMPDFEARQIFSDPASGKELYYLSFPDPTDEQTLRLKDMKGNFIHGSAMYRRTDLERAGGYKLETAQPEDKHLFSRMLALGCRPHHIREALLEYRQHSTIQANMVSRMEAQIKRQAARIEDLEAEITALKAQTSETA